MGNDRTGSSEDFHIVIEVKRTADGTFIRAHIDGAEAQDVASTRALNRLLQFVLAGGTDPAKSGD